MLMVWALAILCPQRAEASQLMVGLQIQATTLQLQYPGEVRDTRLSRLDLLWHERLNGWLDGRLRLGTQVLTQSSNPLPAGQSTRGNALGMGLSFWLYRGDGVNIHADMDYLYTDSQAELSSQSVEQRWHQLSAQLQGDIHLFRYSYLTLAVGTMVIDGDEVATGTVNTASIFRTKNKVYGKIGFSLGLDPDSHIGIEVSAGSQRGGYITFQRWF